jgi:polysaccharide export outer membrane protein
MLLPFPATWLAARIFRILSVTFACLAGAASLAGAARADMLLGPGDSIRLSIHGLQNSSVESTVGMDGSLAFAWPGTVQASDKTLEEISAQIRLLANGRVYKHYTNEGLLKILQLDANDISLEVANYRPVFVTGDVARPGEVQFRPGITVRAALAVAGGVRSSLLSDLAIADPTQIVRWQNEYDRAALDHATAIARLWRVGAEIAGSADTELPDPQSVAVVPNVFGALIEEQRHIVAMRLDSAEKDRSYLREVLEQARNRVAILREQRANQAEQVAADEQEQTRVEDLVSRSLVPAARLEEARRTVVLSKSGLLELEAQLAQTDLDVTLAARELDAYDERRQTEVLEMREQLTAMMIEASLRMNMLSQNLAGAADGEGVSALLLRSNASIYVFRNDRGTVRRVGLDLDSPLLPGDTVEVVLDQPVGLYAGQ